MGHFGRVGKMLVPCCIFFAWVAPLGAQTPVIDQLRKALQEHTQEDTIRVNRLNSLAYEMRNKNPKESAAASQESLTLSRKINYPLGEATALMSLGFHHRFKGEFETAQIRTNEALQKFIEIKDTIDQIACVYNLAYINASQGNLTESFTYSVEGLKLAESIHNIKWLILCKTQLGGNLAQVNETKRAKTYLMEAMQLADSVGNLDGVEHCLASLGRIAEKEGKYDEALEFFNRKIQIGKDAHDYFDIMLGELSIASMYSNRGKYDYVFQTIPRIRETINERGFTGLNSWTTSLLAIAYLNTNELDSAIKYGLICLRTESENSPNANIRNINKVLGEAYARKGQFKEAFRYQQTYLNFKDSLNEAEAMRNISAIQFTYDLEKKQTEIDLLAKNQALVNDKNSQQQKLLWATGAGIVLLMSMLFFLWRNNQQRMHTNLALKRQQDELKATQSQLIQSEKMASLGELTAGIAHEIQNPLNFVNNFSEVNKELIDELEQELDSGNKDEAKAVAKSIRENEEKINHHGKRADAIVKGMLQHSRSSSGVKDPTDINALADEYLRLAYHGLRAKDKSFNALMETAYDGRVGTVSVVPQEIGRVILNLITNAFYAVTEKKKFSGPEYQPTVSVSTRKVGDTFKITVKDNGNGIPQKTLDKIFQPFFTTKPTGQGTGLGLSISYDIVKAHGGDINVRTEENNGSEFIITLPM